MKDYIYTVVISGRLLYEGPIRKNAVDQFSKATERINGSASFKVTKNSRVSYEGAVERRAKGVLVDLLQELSTSKRSTDVISFEVSAEDIKATFTVKPFAEASLGGDPQHGV